MKQFDVVIIGSGISALTCAALLSKKGKSVCVLERYNKAGGYMHCFRRFGLRFDTGAHYVGALGPDQPFRMLLEFLGVYDDELFVPLDPDGFDVFKFPDMEVSIPVGYEKLIDRLCTLFPKEHRAIETYFALIQSTVRDFPTYQLNSEVDFKRALAAVETPLGSAVERLTSDPRLQLIFYSYCVLHGVDPHDVSLGIHALVTDSLIQGAYGFKHGGDGLTRSFVNRIRSNGGIVQLKKGVSRILTGDDGLATGVVCADGEVIGAHWVISGVHPKLTLELVDRPEIFSPAFRSRMQSLKETVGLFGVYGRRTQNTGINALKNYYFFSNQDPKKFMTANPPNEIPNAAFLSPASRDAEGLVHVNIHAIGPQEWFSQWSDSSYEERPEAYKQFKDGYCQQIFKLIDRYQPGFEASMDSFVSSSPLSNLHFNGTPEGSPYGIYHSIQNTGPRSIGPKTKIPNLLLTGQSSLFPGLLAGTIAGLRTAGHIVGIKPVLKEMRGAEALL